MSDLASRTTSAVTAVLDKVDAALAAAAPSAPSDVPDPITGVPASPVAARGGRPQPARKASVQGEDKIEALYGHRAETKEQLLERGVLKDDKVAPAIQAQTEALRRAQRQNSLESQLKTRPAPEDLIKEGILNEDEDPTSPI